MYAVLFCCVGNSCICDIVWNFSCLSWSIVVDCIVEDVSSREDVCDVLFVLLVCCVKRWVGFWDVCSFSGGMLSCVMHLLLFYVWFNVGLRLFWVLYMAPEV